MAKFQSRFNILFEESELSQEAFGNLLGVTKSQIYNWRSGRGEPDSEMMKRIASICKVSVDWLVGSTDIRTPITTIAAHRTDDPMDDLPPEAIRSIEEFKDLMRLKYKKKPSK